MSESEPAVARGRSFLGELIAMAQTRLEMLSLEIEREKLWVLGALRAAFLMAICAWLAGFTLILWMALSLPPGIRSVVMGSVFVALSLATLGGWIALKRSIRRHAPFSRLTSQLGLDRASLGQGP
jgi:uncharacterized membrane protein YqjE